MKIPLILQYFMRGVQNSLKSRTLHKTTAIWLFQEGECVFRPIVCFVSGLSSHIPRRVSNVSSKVIFREMLCLCL